MTWSLRITTAMLNNVRADLVRPHAFAAERVGFLLARIGSAAADHQLILPATYLPVADFDYVQDPKVGARIGSGAIRAVMQAILSGGYGAFHVHIHEHPGRPRFSMVDIANYPALVASFHNVAPQIPHGALLLSEDSCDALVWRSARCRSIPGGRIVVIGRPTEFMYGSDVYGHARSTPHG